MICFSYQFALVKQGKCPTCSGEKTILSSPDDYTDNRYRLPCPHCGGTGEPNKDDLMALGLHTNGLCSLCRLPVVQGKTTESRMQPTGENDCLAHATQQIHELKRVVESQSKTLKDLTDVIQKLVEVVRTQNL